MAIDRPVLVGEKHSRRVAQYDSPTTYFSSCRVSPGQLESAARVLQESGLIPRSMDHWEVVELASQVLEAALPSSRV